MMLSPAWARAATVMNCAAWPDAAATAATPPSRAAMRFSKTSTVGWREGGMSVRMLERVLCRERSYGGGNERS